MTHETDKTAVKPLRSIPADIQALFGDPPLLSTEDPARYRDMLDRFAESIAPRNIIEWLWVKDIVDLSWEIPRLRRYRALLIERARESKNAEIEYARGHADDPDLYLSLRPPTSAQIEARRNAPRLDTEADSANLLILEYLETFLNGCPIEPGVLPQPVGDCNRVDAGSLPPLRLVAVPLTRRPRARGCMNFKW